MDSIDNLNIYEKQLTERQFADVIAQFNILSEWVDRNFTDVDFSVEFNDDSQNPVRPAFIIRSRLFTGTDMTPEDRLLKKHEIVITKQIWDDPILMGKFIKNIVPSFQKSITKEVNDWYRYHKAKFTV